MSSLTEDLKAQEKQPSDEMQTERVLTVVGGHFAHDSFSAFISPLLVPIRAQLGIGFGLAGNLSIFIQAPSLLNPFIGYLADRISLRYFIILAPAITDFSVAV